MAKSYPDVQATNEWRDIASLPGFATIANQRVTLQAKAGKFNHVYIGGAVAPSPSDGIILSAGMSVTGTSDHFWVRGTDAIAVLVED